MNPVALGHTIEPELLKPAPRIIRLRQDASRKKFAGCIGCFLIPHTLVGIGIVVWFFWSVLLMVAGQSLPGQITARYTDRDDDGKTIYHLRYSYRHDGRIIENKAAVGQQSYDAYTEGSAVPVKVSPLAPQFAPRLDIPGNRSSLHPLLVLGFALFWNSIVGVFWVQLFGGPRRQKRLVRNGTPVFGRVLMKRVVTGSYGDTHYIRYEYFANGAGQFGPLPAIFELTEEETPPTGPYSTLAGSVAVIDAPSPAKTGWRGRIAQAKAEAKLELARTSAPASPCALTVQETVDAKDFGSVQVGGWITVLHDPAKPKHAVAYPFSSYEAV